MLYFEDHGLPLVQLKEKRRTLITSLARCKGRHIASEHLFEIAALQQAIAAIEAVITDFDTEISWMVSPARVASVVQNVAD